MKVRELIIRKSRGSRTSFGNKVLILKVGWDLVGLNLIILRLYASRCGLFGAAGTIF